MDDYTFTQLGTTFSSLIEESDIEKLPKPDFNEIFKESVKIIFTKDISITFNKKEMRTLDFVLDGLMKDPFINAYYTRSYIENYLTNLIRKSYDENPKERKKFVINRVKYIRRIIKKDLKEWIFLIPLYNIVLQRWIIIGGIKLYKFNNHRERILKREIKNIIFSNKNYNDNQKKNQYKDIKELFITPLRKHSIAEIKVKGCYDIAKEKALYQCSLVLSVIRLFSYIDYDNKKKYFNIEGNIIERGKRIINSFTENWDQYVPFVEWYGPSEIFNIDKNYILNMNKYGLKIINDMINLIDENIFYNEILTSIYWYGKAKDIQVDVKSDMNNLLKSHNVLERYLFLIISLETISISVKKSSNIAEAFSTNVSILVSNDFNERNQTKERLRKYYDKRSEIVHNGMTDVTKIEMFDLDILAKKAIINLLFILKMNNITNSTQLNKFFKKEKYIWELQKMNFPLKSTNKSLKRKLF